MEIFPEKFPNFTKGLEMVPEIFSEFQKIYEVTKYFMKLFWNQVKFQSASGNIFEL